MFHAYFKYGKKNENRNTIEKLEHIGFTFVNKNENPDISFRRVGVNAGNIDVHILYF